MDMKIWRHGDKERRRHRDMDTWRHGDTETWRHGDMKAQGWIQGDMGTSNR
jgi:hypothetical protein